MRLGCDVACKHIRTCAVGGNGSPHMASARQKHLIYGGTNGPVGPQLRNSYLMRVCLRGEIEVIMR